MTNLVEMKYAQTGESVNIDETGMRPMAARAYKARNAQYLLIKAPPASNITAIVIAPPIVSALLPTAGPTLFATSFAPMFIAM